MRSVNHLLLGTALVVLAGPMRAQQGHAHNDYVHARPLAEALERGFTSVEADVHLVNGRLLVAHHKDSVDVTRTLESLYLAPLRAWLSEPRPRITLLIDVKSNAESTYVALDSVLRRYADILTIHGARTVAEGRVTAVISGERAIATMHGQDLRFAGIDGRLADLAASPRDRASLMPLISDSWERVTKWKGDGPPPAGVRPDLERIVQRAHAHGQRVRFWATPDNEAVWSVLAEAGVDLIGADDLGRLEAFLSHRRRQGNGVRGSAERILMHALHHETEALLVRR